MASSNSESSAQSAASHASQHPPPPVQPTVVFSVPNMKYNLSIKLTKGNFMAWWTQKPVDGETKVPFLN
jgi:hypothetical protein